MAQPQDLLFEPGDASDAPVTAARPAALAARAAAQERARRASDRPAARIAGAGLVHASHRAPLRLALAWILVLALIEAATFLLVPAQSEVPNYPALHTVLETLTVVIAALVFSVGWNAYRRQLPTNILLVACAFLGVALLDFSHLLTHPGMPDLIVPSGAQTSLVFWLAARLLAAATLLAVALRPWRPMRRPEIRYFMLAAVVTLTAGLQWAIFSSIDDLPAVFVSGRGPTALKNSVEYLVMGLDIAAALLLLRRMREPQPFNAAGLFAVACTMAMGEFFFTRYTRIGDMYSLFGHLYKVASYLYLYFAIFVEAIELPYAQLQESQNQLKATLDAMPEMLFEIGQDGTVYYHHAAHARLHAGESGELIGRNISEILPGAAAESFLHVIERARRTGHSQGLQVELPTPEGRRWFELSASRKAAAFNEAQRFIVLLHDISATKAAEDAIQHLAFYDQLTGLSNRRLLIDRLRHALAANSRSGREGALLFLDLDNFKSLNDTLGHDFGDLLLQQVARRLLGCVRDGDTVARFGGDEFVILLEDLSAEAVDAAAQAEAVCNKVFFALNRPYDLGGREYRNSPSIGVTLFREHQEAVEDLLKQADIAMYQAKKAGRNTFRFFDPQMQGAVTSRAALEGELHKALERRQLQLYYQIQVDDSGLPLGAEALIRWNHPERGVVSPGFFIPLAEETGLIVPIGRWVLDTACAQLSAWALDPATRQLDMCVNISAKQFRQSDFVVLVQEAVQRHGIDSRRLKLELTESMLLEHSEETISTMNAIKEIGVRFSLDDFGTGYSSLQYLKRLPLDQLKIDQSFVRDLATDESDKVIVRTIIAMAQSLNFDVIAEGVETPEQRDLLLRRGCRRFQGYLFGRPVPIEPFATLLRRMLEERHAAAEP
jgi:diguanylate cyclase (GGDEF)-like protein/PAS domain S-box-containing protein